MAPGITHENQIRGAIEDHLRLRRKGDAVQLVWEDTSERVPGKVWTTLISEVNITDIPNQRRGNRYHTKK